MNVEPTPELTAKTLRDGAIAHGFAGRDRAVAEGFHVVRGRQVHGVEIRWVDETTTSPAGDCDALATDRPGVAVAIATADCVPMLLSDPAARVVAAVHAGWRGTLAGITGVALDALREHARVEPRVFRVALGPSIDGCCFEVEREIAQRFADRFGELVWRAWRDESPSGMPGKGTLDLREINRQILVAAGVPDAAIERTGPCTACGGGPFASYRREGPNAGRQLSWIGLARST